MNISSYIKVIKVILKCKVYSIFLNKNLFINHTKLRKNLENSKKKKVNMFFSIHLQTAGIAVILRDLPEYHLFSSE